MVCPFSFFMRFGTLFLAAALLLAQESPQALYRSGKQNADRSIEAFNQLLKAAPESGYVLALLGEVKTKEREYTAALYAYNQAAKRLPRLRGIHTALAELYRAQDKPQQADSETQDEAKLGPPDCDSERLYCDYRSAKFQDVIAAVKGKRDPESLYWQTRAYNELSLQALTELGHLPDSMQLHQVKAQIFQDQAQFAEAVAEWRKVLEFSPGDEDAQHRLATALYQSHDYQANLPELETLLKKEPQSANLNFFVGDSLLATEQIEPAIPYLETAVKLDPSLLPAQASLGLCYARMGQPLKAIPHLKAALSLDNDGSLHYQLAKAYTATGQPALAKEMMAKYQALRKNATAAAP
jgi:predicted Zn-dependent protease